MRCAECGRVLPDGAVSCLPCGTRQPSGATDTGQEPRWERCKIYLEPVPSGRILAPHWAYEAVSVGPGGPAVVARTAAFRTGSPDTARAAKQAYDGLVAGLVADGWEVLDVGPEGHHRFRRRVT